METFENRDPEKRARLDPRVTKTLDRCISITSRLRPFLAPLRTAADREAILEGLVDGTLEIIASDHAPHTESEKEVEFDDAPFGIVGLELELPLSLMQLYQTGRLSLSRVIEKLTINPARFLKLSEGRGTLSVGAWGDITVFDPEASWVCDRRDTASLSQNNPFNGWPMKGRVTGTFVGGQRVFSR
jgi:dihydroorotase